MDKENLARKSDHSKTTPRKLTPFTAEECEKIQNQLDRPIDNSDIQFRPAAQGTVAYLEGWKALNLANEVFGFNGWCSEILSLTTDFVDIVEGKVSLGVSCMLRVHLKDGTFHDVNKTVFRLSFFFLNRILDMGHLKIRGVKALLLKRLGRKLLQML